MKKMDTKEFIKRSKERHGDKYDYSKTVYVNSKTLVEIVCPRHGPFWQRPGSHYYMGCGCAECGKMQAPKSHTLTTEEFIRRARLVHGDRYNYSKSIYKRNNEKIEIICPRHGSFWQNAGSHIGVSKAGCPKCNYSKGESLIFYYLSNRSLKFKTQYSFPDCRYKKPLRFDFYLPDHDICIEFDGKQHFTHDKFYNARCSVELNKLKDSIKDNYCKDHDIKLIRIPYTRIENIKDILDEEI